MDNPDNRLRVWVKTWAQVIEENRARLRFVQERLGYEPDHEDALQRFKLRYAELFARMESADAVSTETVAAET